MNNLSIKAGTTDVSVVIRIIDSTDGTPEIAVEHNTSGIDLEYRREGAASTDITEAALTALTDAHSDGGIEHIGNGYYRLDLPDAACASGATGVLIHGTVTGMVVIGCYVQLVAYNPFDTVRLGLTALPNAAADAAGGLPISDAGGLDLDAQIGTKVNDILTDTGTTLQGELDGIQADTEDIQTRLPAALVSGRMDSNVQAMATGVITATVIAADAIGASELAADAVAEIADQVWDEAIAGHAGAGSTGAALSAAGSAGDPWSTALPGAYGAGTAGKIVGDNINAAISSRASQTSLDTVDDFLDTEIAAILADTNELQTDWTNGGRLDLLIDAILEDTGTTLDDFLDTEIAAIKAKTDQLTFTSANKVDATMNAAGDLPAAVGNKIADHVLRRTYANARTSSDGDTLAFRSLIGAIGKLVNRWYFSGGNLLTTHEDDTTTFGTQAVTTDAAAEPITELNTA